MKLCYIVHNRKDSFYRYMQYLPFFKKKGDEISVIKLKNGTLSRINDIIKAGSSDIVIIQRKLLQPWESLVLSLRPCKIIFDFDDAILLRSSVPYNSFGRKIKFIPMVRFSDAIVVGNSYLKGLTEKYTDPDKIHILPTPLDLSKYRKKDYTEKSTQITLGWIGSKSTLKYLKKLIPVFNKLGKKYKNLKLKIVADEFFDCDQLPVEKKQWRYDDEVDDLVSFDIGLMPLDDNPWSNGKCSFKLIQYIAVGIPSVCSPVGMNCDVIKNSRHGLWAASLEEWEKHLSTLIENPDLRKELGSNAHETATRYDQVNIFEEFYKIILDTL